MKVIDPGHSYLLRRLDVKRSGYFNRLYEKLRFVKRRGKKYPGNTTAHHGTTIQEVLRVLIHRARFLDQQEHWYGNQALITDWRLHLYQLEARAADRHGRTLQRRHLDRDNQGNPVGIEDDPTCELCGHIECGGSCRAD
jgi:hypothetical protein